MSVIPFPSPLSAARPLRQAGIGIPKVATITIESRPAVWLRRWRDRRALAALDLDQIRDAGLDPLLVRREAAKPFWRA